ncbi:MAG: putative metal-binding motif-containing protein [Myxococcales bacterium]|nr:putative metal-binding motif-containing protein [Myxococcales bacterium]
MHRTLPLAAVLLLACKASPDPTADPTDGPTDVPVEPQDLDGDGFTDADDCDDDDPAVFPGAPERCDGQRNDCGGSWTSDAGVVDFEPVGGPVESWSSTFAAGGTVSIDRAGTLRICPGTYDVALSYGANAVPAVVIGTGATLTGDPDGPGGLGIVDYAVEGDLTVEGLTLQGGSADYGGALFAGGTVVLRDVVLTGNEAPGADDTGWGGAVYVAGDLTLEGVSFTDNTAGSNGGGLVVEAGSVTGDAHFEGNHATRGGALLLLDTTGGLDGASFLGNGAANGGHVYLSASTVTFTDTTIEDTAGDSDNGGGILMFGGSLTLVGSTVSDNTATAHGGGIYADGATLTLQDSAVVDNLSVRFIGLQPSGLHGYGGGVYLNDASLVCVDSDLGQNQSRWGAATYADFSSTGGATITSTSCDWNSTPILGSSTASQVDIVIDGFVGSIDYDPGTNATFTCDVTGCVTP